MLQICRVKAIKISYRWYLDAFIKSLNNVADIFITSKNLCLYFLTSLKNIRNVPFYGHLVRYIDGLRITILSKIPNLRDENLPVNAVGSS